MVTRTVWTFQDEVSLTLLWQCRSTQFSSNSKLAHSIHEYNFFLSFFFSTLCVNHCWAFTKNVCLRKKLLEILLCFDNTHHFFRQPSIWYFFVTFYSWNFIIIISFVNVSSHSNEYQIDVIRYVCYGFSYRIIPMCEPFECTSFGWNILLLFATCECAMENSSAHKYKVHMHTLC